MLSNESHTILSKVGLPLLSNFVFLESVFQRLVEARALLLTEMDPGGLYANMLQDVGHSKSERDQEFETLAK